MHLTAAPRGCDLSRQQFNSCCGTDVISRTGEETWRREGDETSSFNGVQVKPISGVRIFVVPVVGHRAGKAACRGACGAGVLIQIPGTRGGPCHMGASRRVPVLNAKDGSLTLARVWPPACLQASTWEESNQASMQGETARCARIADVKVRKILHAVRGILPVVLVGFVAGAS